MASKLTLIDTKPGSPPRPLGEHGSALWRSIVSEYDITDAAGIEMLCLGCESLDRAEQIKALIDYAGVGAVSEAGLVRANPLIRDELACRAFTSKCLERLGLNNAAPKQNGRPPGSWNLAKSEKSTA